MQKTDILLTLLVSFFLCVFCCYFLRRISLRKSLLMPGGVPLVGGIAMGWSFACASLTGMYLFKFISGQIYGVVLASLVMLAFGMLDDWREQSIKAKLLAQFFVAALLIAFNIRTHIVIVGDTLNYIITVIWVVAIINSFNYLDVMDGVAGVIALMSGLAFLGLGLMNRDIQVIILSLALVGGCAGFLLFNFPPATVYMGNAGSHFLGLLLAAIALVISYTAREMKVAIFTPLLILGLPFFCSAFLFIVRLYKKKLPLRTRDDHPALRFLSLGYSKRKALLVIGLWNFIFVIFGIIVSGSPYVYGLIAIVLAVLINSLIAGKAYRV